MNKKIGIALSGGGVEGFAHIGALKALEELNIEIDCLAGTSSGSVVAALYAMGYNPEEIKMISLKIYHSIRKIHIKRFLKAVLGFAFRKHTYVNGLFDSLPIEKIINHYAKKKGYYYLSDLNDKILAVVTAEIVTLRECVFSSCMNDKGIDDLWLGENITIGQAIRASMAFPAVFGVVDYEHYQFIDGGTVNNLPTSVLEKMGINHIIAVDFNIESYTPSHHLEDHALRALDMYSYDDVKRAEKLADIVINVYNPQTNICNISNIDETIQNGYDAVMAHRNELLQWNHEEK